jgi:hypothetical protein
MDQFNKWQEYWDNYLLNKHGKEEVKTEADLFFQVARTVQKKPVEKEIFDEMIREIIGQLSLDKDDFLVDFCCGNGLFTYELKDCVHSIIAVDFSEQIINTAKKYKSASNIAYYLGSVIEFLKGFQNQFPGVTPTKYLMNDALAYFSVSDLEEMVKLIRSVSGGSFVFLLRGVPDDALKWNFYNTDERKEKYLSDIAKGDITNDGLGRWWSKNEVETICNPLDLQCTFIHPEHNNYRMDILITKK